MFLNSKVLMSNRISFKASYLKEYATVLSTQGQSIIELGFE